MARTALLLDLDGTLLDIAPTPDPVVVPPGLIASLHALRTRLDGALAVISGRPVEQVEPAAGRGPRDRRRAWRRGAPRAGRGARSASSLPTPPEAWFAAGARIAAAHPGVTAGAQGERLRAALPRRPGARPALGEAMAALVAGSDRFAMLPAHMAWEVRPRGADKGIAVAALMRRPPFAGRVPVFIGDDVTDEDAMAEARRTGRRRVARGRRVRHRGRRAGLAARGRRHRHVVAPGLRPEPRQGGFAPLGPPTRGTASGLLPWECGDGEGAWACGVGVAPREGRPRRRTPMPPPHPHTPMDGFQGLRPWRGSKGQRPLVGSGRSPSLPSGMRRRRWLIAGRGPIFRLI